MLDVRKKSSIDSVNLFIIGPILFISLNIVGINRTIENIAIISMPKIINKATFFSFILVCFAIYIFKGFNM